MFLKDIANIIKVVETIIKYAENPTIRNDFLAVIQSLDQKEYNTLATEFNNLKAGGVFERLYTVIRTIKANNPLAYEALIKEFESFA